ncbi:hypothetical protein CCAX7_54920 [Capsulimonas corticalis]|uniref:Uncharacterized protein n=1 Tax=Capsulimonas corticalis TaxID=2219043 RepID=A0A402D5R9_9BACT|nr:ASCH domain-containing protein [Capsulimonas corticalis]BDI33441.1 hypothetical protein CCAX7_54920 [Capsulimonas corticalis]
MIINPPVKPRFIPATSLWNPWAMLMALEEKRNETRHWSTTYRGPIVIHAAQRFQPGERLKCAEQPFKEVFLATILKDVDWDALGGRTAAAYDKVIRDLMPCSALLCIVNIVDCRETTSKAAARHRYGDYEEAFGDYNPGRYAFVTEMVRVFEEPIPYSGKQGWFHVPEELVL